MPINIDSVLSSQPKTMKDAIDKISRNGLSLQNPSRGGAMYITSAPGTADLDEGQFVLYLSAGVYRIYTKINNVIKYWTLT